ncbi:GNAT family N-acetyltransferase [Cryobacterium sp. SO2]|uniref:GNAT family N-acetyltransferase n=1 Tax=Cryobacterium sp. SO2 TaxID=1897060 RepID=UPI00223D4AB5|nr:GNAT family N-acetyltransferase [Cryobacterium sp. SO2]WEO76129.1 GNAT family N-acetyltransferase [Cryobacterium sp. SO2]
MTTEWTLAPSSPADASWMAELRAVVMRADLERLGRWDPVRVRQRFLAAFDSAHTSVITVDGASAGLIAVRPETDALWIEHFYLQPAQQGRGIGGQVLREIMATQGDTRPFRLNVLQGSPARTLYERNGFVVDRQDPIDVYLEAPPRLR